MRGSSWTERDAHVPRNHTLQFHSRGMSERVTYMFKTLFSTQSNKAWLALLGAVATALVAGARDNVLDMRDYLTAIEAGILALGIVYGVGNATPKNPE